MTPAVFLDRDGVLTRAIVRDGRPYAPRSLEDFEIVDGAGTALAALKDAGFVLVVTTNQPDVRTGMVSRSVVEEMHRRLASLLPVDAIKVCYHVDEDGCACRKPKPGMLLEAARDMDIDLMQSFMIGDRWRDIVAGRSAGCRTILIEGVHEEAVAEEPHARASSVSEASRMILSGRI